MLNILYIKCLKLAEHKSSKFYLAFVAFIESSFFPIPPDAMIVPMVIANKKKYLSIFLTATIFSVLGGIFGYILGAIFIDLSMNVIEFYGYEEKISNLELKLKNGNGFYAWFGIIFLAGFTPLPYKVFTIASGMINFSLPVFIFASLISRGLRFFIVAYLSYKFGNLFTKFMSDQGSKLFTILGIAIVAIFITIFLFLK